MRTDNGWKHKTAIQKLQQKVARGVADYEKNDSEDLALIMAYRDGNETAGITLVHNYLDIISNIYTNPHKPPRISKVARQKMAIRLPHMNTYDKEDILQEILYNFFKLVDEFDPEFGVPFQGLVKGKLFLRFYKNFYQEFFDNKNSEMEFKEELDHESLIYKARMMIEQGGNEKTPAEYMELYHAFNQLGARQREVLEMSIIKGWNATEISQEIGIAPATVRVTLKKGLARMRDLLITEEETI
jgi:RNA polymerase sigma factor (sigma-70 family)